MRVNYIRVNPSGNITLLVTDPVPRKMHSDIARQLMQMDAGSEQVGFLEEASLPGARLRLQMMGGEFCGNATMSAAAYLAQMDGLADGAEKVYPLEVSGCRNVISCRIARAGNSYTGTVPMPLPWRITEAETLSILPDEQVARVCFEGIDHLIVPGELLSVQQAEGFIASLCAAFDVEALGILLYNEETGGMRPLVYVRSTGSAVWENSCGSGSAAVGAWQAFVQKRDVRLDVHQPCPDTCIGVSAGYADGKISPLEITGRVCIEKSAEAKL